MSVALKVRCKRTGIKSILLSTRLESRQHQENFDVKARDTLSLSFSFESKDTRLFDATKRVHGRAFNVACIECLLRERKTRVAAKTSIAAALHWNTYLMSPPLAFLVLFSIHFSILSSILFSLSSGEAASEGFVCLDMLSSCAKDLLFPGL